MEPNEPWPNHVSTHRPGSLLAHFVTNSLISHKLCIIILIVGSCTGDGTLGIIFRRDSSLLTSQYSKNIFLSFVYPNNDHFHNINDSYL